MSKPVISKDQAWVNVQKITFTRWMNAQLQISGSDKQINNLATDLSDGVILAHVVTGLSGKVTGLSGKVSGLSGKVSGLSGKVTGLSDRLLDFLVRLLDFPVRLLDFLIGYWTFW